MIHSILGILFFMCFLVLAFAVDARCQEVTIYRDTYGVPHIYGDSEEAVAFGQGYAQAEDRLNTLLKAYLKARGRMAKAFGEDWLEHEYIKRAFRHE